MAAEDTKGKKRKGAPDAAPKAKKPRKSDDITVSEPKPAKAPKATKAKPSRKEAADFFSDDDAPAVEPVVVATKKTKGKKKGNVAVIEEVVVAEPAMVEAPKEKAKKSKKSKKTEAAPVEEVVAVEVEEEVPAKKSKKSKSSKKQAEPVEAVVEDIAALDEFDGEVEEDDQTAALLAGFTDSEDEDPDDDEGFDTDAVVPTITKKQKTALEKAAKGPKSNEPGVVYVGRVPRGFFEPEMKKYFSQFGKINHLRLSRNKKTGASKHYAFVEFASTEVADIVARTMDNYLLFGHILKCKLIPAEQVHPDLFKGAGQRFKVDPRNKKAGLSMARGVERAQWEKRVEKETTRRADRKKQLKDDFGYEYTAPALKAVNSVPQQLQNGDAPQQIAAAPADEAALEAPGKPKKAKKASKATPSAAETTEPALTAPGKKAKKNSAQAEVQTELDLQADIAANLAPTPEKKAKKAKKAAKTAPVEPEEPAAEEVVEKKRKAKAEGDVPKVKKAKKVKA